MTSMMMRMRKGHNLGGHKKVKKALGPKRVDGQYDRLRLQDAAVWVRIHPNQEYTQVIYDRDEQAVIEATNLWYRTESHWVQALNGGRGMVVPCTREPGESLDDSECDLCRLNGIYWNWVRATEDITGVRPKQGSPAGNSSRDTISLVVVEDIYGVPLRESSGAIRKGRTGRPIVNEEPAPFVPRDERKNLKGFGKKMYLDLSMTHRNQLLEINDRMRCHCAKCAGELMLLAISCEECGEVIQDYSEDPVVEWTEIREITNSERTCSSCRHSGIVAPIHACMEDDCDGDTPGSILDFELRLRLQQDAEKRTSLVLERHRVPTEDARIEKLLETPLDIEAIKEGRPLDDRSKSKIQELISDWEARLSELEEGRGHARAYGQDDYQDDL